MPANVQLSGASVLGRDHALVRKNCQDSFALGQQNGAVWGVVCDGCGEGDRSELGAHLTSVLLHRSFALSARFAEPGCVSRVVETANERLYVFYSKMLQDLYPLGRWGTEAEHNDMRLFAFHHMLCTVVAFFAYGDEAVVFWAGDGSFEVNGERTTLDSGNRPKYPIYPVLKTIVPEPMFESRTLTVAPGSKIAISTDGFDAEFSDVYGKTPNALKRWMNVVQKRDRKFQDDATVVVAEWF